jgi:hypothetical protein
VREVAPSFEAKVPTVSIIGSHVKGWLTPRSADRTRSFAFFGLPPVSGNGFSNSLDPSFP